MLYNNLIYFLVVIFLFSTDIPPDQPDLPAWLAVFLFFTGCLGLGFLARKVFAKPHLGSSGYFSAEKKLSILSVLLFSSFLYILDLKYYFLPVGKLTHVPALTDLSGLCCYFLLLAIIWSQARTAYQRLFGQQYTTIAFISTNIRINLPIVIPWLVLSLGFDVVSLLPFPRLQALLHSPPWGDLVMFLLFVFLLLVLLPPLVKYLWSCSPLPPGLERDRLEQFCQTQGFKVEILSWPLYEGQMLTAAIMGIIPGLRYLLVTPALLGALTEEEVDGVLVHEIGHVRHLHLLLYVSLFLGFSLLMGSLFYPLTHLILGSDFFYRIVTWLPFAPDSVLNTLSTLPLLILLLIFFRFVFGYFIRNFERQADSYVFQLQDTARPLIASFEKILWLSGGRRDEKNWHHYGVGERIDYLVRCEQDRNLVQHHARHLKISLVSYFVLVGLLVTVLTQMDYERFSKGHELQYTEAVLLFKTRQDPRNALSLIAFAEILKKKKLENRAVEAYEKLLKLSPTAAVVNNNLAWLLLTAHDESVRDPHRALSLAKRAVMLEENGRYLDTLATAYWANGELEQAEEAELKALALDPELGEYYQEQLERFAQKKWREGRGDLEP